MGFFPILVTLDGISDLEFTVQLGICTPNVTQHRKSYSSKDMPCLIDRQILETRGVQLIQLFHETHMALKD